MIAWLVKLGPWIIGLVKNIRWLGPFLAKSLERSRHALYVLAWFIAWGGRSALAASATFVSLLSMGASVTAYSVSLSYARGLIPSDLKCTLDYLHFFNHLRNIVFSGLAILSLRVGIIAYKLGNDTYRNFVMGLLDKLKSSKG